MLGKMKKFKRTYIEITNVCNLACGFCPKTKRLPEYMRTELFQTILSKIKGNSEYLYFHVMGEPLMHPQIGKFLDMCAEYGYKVNLTTNGTLTEKVLEILDKLALRQINFSLHSPPANSGISYETYLEKIFSLITVAKKAGRVLFCLRLWNITGTDTEGKNAFVIEKINKEYNPEPVIENIVTQARGIKLQENVFLNISNEFKWPDINGEDFGATGYCYGLKEQVAILVDGTVVPCCLDRDGDIKLGNIKEHSLEEIINTAKAKKIHDGFAKRKVTEELCRKCGYRTRFGGK